MCIYLIYIIKCTYDFYIAGTDSSSTKLAEICDSSATFIDSESYYSTANNAFINFKSLLSGRNRRGFLIAYNETDTGILNHIQVYFMACMEGVM